MWQCLISHTPMLLEVLFKTCSAVPTVEAGSKFRRMMRLLHMTVLISFVGEQATANLCKTMTVLLQIR